MLGLISDFGHGMHPVTCAVKKKMWRIRKKRKRKKIAKNPYGMGCLVSDIGIIFVSLFGLDV